MLNTNRPALALTLAALAPGLLAETLRYPSTRKVDHTDTYFGHTVEDPYRWLEDEKATGRSAWVEAQNKVTFGYLDQIPFRARLRKRLDELNNIDVYSSPFRHGPYIFFERREGLKNHSVLYIQREGGQPEVLLDPNTFSQDGTTGLSIFQPSADAKFAVYGRSQGGSDWQELRVIDLATKQELPDRIEWVKSSGASWRGHGFYYSRYPAPPKGQELTQRNEHHRVYFHRAGTRQSEDELVFEDPANPVRFHYVGTTEDEKYGLLLISDRGRNKLGPAVWIRDESKAEKKFRPLFAEPSDFNYLGFHHSNGWIYVRTNNGAPNYRVVRCRPDKPGIENCETVIPEKSEPMQSASFAGGRILVRYSKDVTSRVLQYAMDGKLEREIRLPGPGMAFGFGGRDDAKSVFYTFSSLHLPATIYDYEIGTGKSTVFRKPQTAFNTEAFETRQLFFKSKDGTRVPLFAAHKKGLKLDGSNPAILFGYGGFNIPASLTFSNSRVAFLEQGGVFAVACIRGGSEYGETWHQAGMRLNKQNVFDDFIAAAEFLQEQGYTSKKKLALQGGSNGGLLVGAVMNQRPDLFHVALPAVGVMDMLRFHKFTIGWNWVAEYGSADATEGEFKNLRAYSPLHNLKPASYPATLVTTADHDDRVVPAHSFKYIARLQELQRGSSPVLIRIETKSGHGASNLSKLLDTLADQYSFALYQMGVTPR
ncbi:MAG: S9 family peptidase [Acidobacteria bacterium]|nr:S9 family peptidase [Acidobacteriota bacterium]